jgi:hypothetical protein
VLELILNFLLHPVSSFILQIPRMMNYRKRLTPPSFLWQFWAKLPALLVSAAKFIARAVPVFTRCLETVLCPGLEHRGPNSEATEERPQLYTTYSCPVKHETTLKLFVKSSSISLFHCAFQFTIYNGPTNTLVCNKTLIQMPQIKTLKITPTCFDHQMIIIRELFDPG